MRYIKHRYISSLSVCKTVGIVPRPHYHHQPRTISRPALPQFQIPHQRCHHNYSLPPFTPPQMFMLIIRSAFSLSVLARLLRVNRRTALYSHHILICKNFRRAYCLPADTCSLVQRVIAVTELFYYVLKTTAGNIRYRISVRSDNERREHCKSFLLIVC